MLEDILKDRQRTHGDYPKIAEIVSTMSVHAGSANHLIDPLMRHAMTMIFTKIARIHCGDPHHADHWRDIAGYATLVADELEAR